MDDNEQVEVTFYVGEPRSALQLAAEQRLLYGNEISPDDDVEFVSPHVPERWTRELPSEEG
jgi:hypothetical protein